MISKNILGLITVVSSNIKIVLWLVASTLISRCELVKC